MIKCERADRGEVSIWLTRDPTELLSVDAVANQFICVEAIAGEIGKLAEAVQMSDSPDIQLISGETEELLNKLIRVLGRRLQSNEPTKECGPGSQS